MPISSSYTSGATTSYSSYLFQPKTLVGSWGSDFLQGGYGDDTILGGYGNDYLHGGYGNDWIDGGADNDFINGGQGNDTLIGGAGHDTVVGGAGNDWLWGGAGNDKLSGDLGKDVIVLGTGSDTIYFNGGTGANQQSVATNAQADVIHDWSSDDFIGQSYSTAGKPYAEFGANVYSVEQAAALANQYYAQGAMTADTGQVFVYNSATDTGYLLLDLDNDASNTFETGAILVGAGQAWDMSGANFI
jgi:Ca2+-binding RTX toxin-like protein